MNRTARIEKWKVRWTLQAGEYFNRLAVAKNYGRKPYRKVEALARLAAHAGGFWEGYGRARADVVEFSTMTEGWIRLMSLFGPEPSEPLDTLDVEWSASTGHTESGGEG